MKHTTFTIALLIANNFVNAKSVDSVTIQQPATAHNEVVSPQNVNLTTADFMQQSLNKSALFSTDNNNPSPAPTTAHPKKQWYENIQMRGYAQVRYNRLLETNPLLKCEQCDKSIGDKNGFSMRRLRLVWYGQVHPRVYMYIQPDLASSLNSALPGMVAQIRDAYFDIGILKNNNLKARVGQSKVPFGFDNMQSSQNRLNLDRSDAINSAFANERDMGTFFMYTPEKRKKLYSTLANDGLKTSGDYGMATFGLFNGQLANNPEANNNLHWVGRFTYPFSIKSQIIEAGVQMYRGQFTLTQANLTNNVKVKSDLTYLDSRKAASFILYPKPFGIQAEYNAGVGPKYNATTDSIETGKLNGGYIVASFKTSYKETTIIPFARYNYYNGGKKMEKDARAYLVKELEFGIEWQLAKNLEITMAYNMADRTTQDKSNTNNHQKGNFLRIQVQVNY